MFWKIFIQTVVALLWWCWGFLYAKKKYKDRMFVPVGGTFKFKGKTYECCESPDDKSCRYCSKEACSSGRFCSSKMRPDKRDVYFRDNH